MPSPDPPAQPQKSTGGAAPRPSRAPLKSTTHVLPFLSHDARPSLMIFHGTEPAPARPLPTLYSFTLYVTAPDASVRETFDAVAAYQTFIFDAFIYVEPVRLDVHFLPGATVQECMRHYEAEKAARGTVRRHMDAVEAGEVPENNGAAPGMMESNLSPPDQMYRDAILVVGDWDWKTEGVEVVMFNRVTEVEAKPWEDEVQYYVEVWERRFRVGFDKGHNTQTVERWVRDWANMGLLQELAGTWERARELRYETW